MADARAIEQVLLGLHRRQTRAAKRKWDQEQGSPPTGPHLHGIASQAMSSVPVADKSCTAPTSAAASAPVGSSPEQHVDGVSARATASVHGKTQPARQRISAASVSMPASSGARGEAAKPLKLSAAQLARLHSWSFLGGVSISAAERGHPRPKQPKKKAQRVRSLEQLSSGSPAQPAPEAPQDPSRVAATAAGASRAVRHCGSISRQCKDQVQSDRRAKLHESPNKWQRPPDSTASAAGAALAQGQAFDKAVDAYDDAAYDALQPLLMHLDPLGSGQATQPAERHSTAEAAQAVSPSAAPSAVAEGHNLLQQAHSVQQSQAPSMAVKGRLPPEAPNVQAAEGAGPITKAGPLLHDQGGPQDLARHDAAALPAKTSTGAYEEVPCPRTATWGQLQEQQALWRQEQQQSQPPQTCDGPILLKG